MSRVIVHFEVSAVVRIHVGQYETRQEKFLGTVDDPYKAISDGFLHFKNKDVTKGIALADIHSYCLRPIFKD